MSDQSEAATPETDAAEVTDVLSASRALEGLLVLDEEDSGGDETQPPATEPEEEAGVPGDTESEDVVAEGIEAEVDGETEGEVDEGVEEPVHEVTLPGGTRSEVTLNELKRSYSREADYHNKTGALAHERREVAAEREQYKTAFAQQRQQYAAQLQTLMQETGQQEEQIDWDHLKEVDPIEYATKWADHQRNLDAKRRAQGEMRRLQAENAQKLEQQRAAALVDQQQRLISAVPEVDLADVETAEGFKGDIRGYLSTACGGFSDQEISQVFDHRHVLLIRKAMKYDEMQAKSQVAAKKVKKAPKVVSGRAKAEKGDEDVGRRTAKQQRARRTGSVEDAASVLEDMI